VTRDVNDSPAASFVVEHSVENIQRFGALRRVVDRRQQCHLVGADDSDSLEALGYDHRFGTSRRESRVDTAVIALGFPNDERAPAGPRGVDSIPEFAGAEFAKQLGSERPGTLVVTVGRTGVQHLPGYRRRSPVQLENQLMCSREKWLEVQRYQELEECIADLGILRAAERRPGHEVADQAALGLLATDFTARTPGIEGIEDHGTAVGGLARQCAEEIV
jgi:hypothetical protein